MKNIRQIIGIMSIAGLFLLISNCSSSDGGNSGTVPDNGLYVACNLYNSSRRSVGIYVWVTDANGYIRTINYYRSGNLLKHDDGGTKNDTPSEWKSHSGASKGGTIDGVSRASQKLSGNEKYTFISDAWDYTDLSSKQVPDGTYRIHVNVCAEDVETAYFYADIDIDGSVKTVQLTRGSSSSAIMTDGSVTSLPVKGKP